MAASPSTRAAWKGAISFGLVHIPVVLYSATAETRPKFNLLDPASMARVGNSKVNKATGEAVQPTELVKGIQVEDGQYVVLTKEEIRSALPRTTQTIEIEAFVDAGEIPPLFYSKPYHVAPGTGGAKPYALLRDVLARTGKVGVAKVVISTRQHLAALMPAPGGLVLELLRWSDEVREAPASTGGAPASSPSERELKMAEQLVSDMATAFSPDLFHDEFKEKLQQLVEAKARAGDIAAVPPLPGEETPAAGADVLDLTELLRRSLQGKGVDAAAPAPAPRARPVPAKPAKPARAPAATREPIAAQDAGPRRQAAANEDMAKPRKRAETGPATKSRAAVKPAPRKRT